MLGKTPVFLKYEDQLMSCLMLLPVVLLVFGPAGSLVVLWKRNMEIGVRDANTSHVASPASWSGAVYFWSARCCWLVRGSPARVYAGDSCRSSRHNDARRFSIWHHLDAHGIPFKVSPQNDTLLITFDSSDQSAAAKRSSTEHCPKATSLRSRTITVRLCGG